MPSAVAYWTVTVLPLAADSLSVKVRFFVPELPSTIVAPVATDLRRQIVVGDRGDELRVDQGQSRPRW